MGMEARASHAGHAPRSSPTPAGTPPAALARATAAQLRNAERGSHRRLAPGDQLALRLPRPYITALARPTISLLVNVAHCSARAVVITRSRLLAGERGGSQYE